MTDRAELPVPVPQRQLSYYVALIFLVIPIWSIIPLAWAFVFVESFTLLRGTRNLGELYAIERYVLIPWAFIEIVFSVYHVFLSRRLASIPTWTPEVDDSLVHLQRRVLQTGLSSTSHDPTTNRPNSPDAPIMHLSASDPRAIEFRHHLRTWFNFAPWSRITRTKTPLMTWLAWSIFNAPLEGLSEESVMLLEQALKLVGMRTGSYIPSREDGHENDRDGDDEEPLYPLRLTLDPMTISLRPFAWYLFVVAFNWIVKKWYMWFYGMSFGVFGGIEYLIRIPSGWTFEDVDSPSTQPVLFMHGLGIGLPQYHGTISRLLNSLPTHPILIPIQPHISQLVLHPSHLTPMPRDYFVQNMRGLLESVGFVRIRKGREEGGVALLSHSNGSIAHAWMLKTHPDVIKRSCFVDPVTFCLWEGDVCYNFVYRPPTNAIQLLMRYFVGSELGIANLIQRHFDWTSNALWFEEIPDSGDADKTLFFLGGKDAIVNTERVKLYLEAHGVRSGLHFDPEGMHGSALLMPCQDKGLNFIVQWLKGRQSNKVAEEQVEIDMIDLMLKK